jgi:hypothetical protein
MTGPAVFLQREEETIVLELILAIVLIVAVVKVANIENRSPVLWGVITFLISAACVVVIPIPFLRIGVAFIAAFAAMMIMKMAGK